MGWYVNYTVLIENECTSRSELFKKNIRDFKYADSTNMPQDKARAWDIAEEKLLKEEDLEKDGIKDHLKKIKRISKTVWEITVGSEDDIRHQYLEKIIERAERIEKLLEKEKNI